MESITFVFNDTTKDSKAWSKLPKISDKMKTLTKFFMYALSKLANKKLHRHCQKIATRLMETAHQFVTDQVNRGDQGPNSTLRENDKLHAFTILAFIQKKFERILRESKLKNITNAFVKFYLQFKPSVDKFISDYPGKNVLHVNWYKHLMHYDPNEKPSPTIA